MIRYIKDARLDMPAVIALYHAVGWSNYTEDPEMLKDALLHSLLVIAAYDNEQLVGLVRVVGDGYSVVFIQDILVLPAYQGRGIGRCLIEMVLEAYSTVYQIHLLTEQTVKTMSFYESLGFMPVQQINCISYTYIR